MSTERHEFLVRSKSIPTVEIDSQSGSAYIRFKKAAVAKTVPQPASSAFFSIDLDSKGEVIGIEALGVNEFTITKLIARVKSVTVSSELMERARYIPVSQLQEAC